MQRPTSLHSSLGMPIIRDGTGRLMLARRILWEVALGATVFALVAAACSGTSAAPSTEVSSAPAAATPTRASTLRSLIAPGAKVKVVASGLASAEGPLWLPDGRLIVSDVSGDAVLAFDAAGHKSDFRRPSNVANGHALDADGLVVEAEAGETTDHPLIARIAADGSATVLADSFRGQTPQRPKRSDREARRHDLVHRSEPRL